MKHSTAKLKSGLQLHIKYGELMKENPCFKLGGLKFVKNIMKLNSDNFRSQKHTAHKDHNSKSKFRKYHIVKDEILTDL